MLKIIGGRAFQFVQRLDNAMQLYHDKAVKLQAELEGHGYQTSSKTWVEPQTLKKMLRESIENGEKIELERFNAYLGTTAVIKGVK